MKNREHWFHTTEQMAFLSSLVSELTKRYTTLLRKERINTGFSIDLQFLIASAF